MDRGTRRGGEGARLWADELVLGWDQPGDVTQHRLPVVSAAEPFTAVRVDACGAGTGLEEPVLGWAQPGVAIQHRLPVVSAAEPFTAVPVTLPPTSALSKISSI